MMMAVGVDSVRAEANRSTLRYSLKPGRLESHQVGGVRRNDNEKSRWTTEQQGVTNARAGSLEWEALLNGAEWEVTLNEAKRQNTQDEVLKWRCNEYSGWKPGVGSFIE